jgi:hypothetical protein
VPRASRVLWLTIFQVTISIDDSNDTQKSIIEALKANTVLLEKLLAALDTENDKTISKKVG